MGDGFPLGAVVLLVLIAAGRATTAAGFVTSRLVLFACASLQTRPHDS